MSYSACFGGPADNIKTRPYSLKALIGKTNDQVLKVDLGNGHNQFPSVICSMTFSSFSGV